jgi:hypothetical protein
MERLPVRCSRFLALAFAAAMAGACAQVEDAPQDLHEEELGTIQQPLTCAAASADSCILTTYDGYAIFRDSSSCSDNGSFYTTDTTDDACCTAGTSGCRYTGLRWQCVEWARRYMWKKWGPVWPSVTGAKDMCANHPSGTTLVSEPVPGDVVVYGANACLSKNSSGTCISKAHATYGHVGVVIGNPSSTKDRVKDQNGPQNAHNDYLKSAAKCYVHATKNPRCWAGEVRKVADSACSSGSAKQTCSSSNTWGPKTCVPVPGSDAGAGGASDAGGAGSAGASGAAGEAGAAGDAGAGASGAAGEAGAAGASGGAGSGAGGSSSASDAGPDAGAGGSHAEFGAAQEGGCSIRGTSQGPCSASLAVMGLALGLAGARARRKRRSSP